MVLSFLKLSIKGFNEILINFSRCQTTCGVFQNSKALVVFLCFFLHSVNSKWAVMQKLMEEPTTWTVRKWIWAGIESFSTWLFSCGFCNLPSVYVIPMWPTWSPSSWFLFLPSDLPFLFPLLSRFYQYPTKLLFWSTFIHCVVLLFTLSKFHHVYGVLRHIIRLLAHTINVNTNLDYFMCTYLSGQVLYVWSFTLEQTELRHLGCINCHIV